MKQTENALLYFTPTEIESNMEEYVRRKSRQEGMRWITPKLNKRILPLDKGDLGTIAMLPGSGKTSLGVTLAREYAREIRAAGKKNEAVLFITIDQPVENIAAMFMCDKKYGVTDFARGTIPMDEAKKRAREFVTMPVYLFGGSVIDARIGKPRLTFDNIERGIIEMEKHIHSAPSLIVIDYIQILPVEKKTDRVREVEEAVYRTRELCIGSQIPILMLAQATRGSREKDFKLPVPQESQHSSAIEQASSVWIGGWRPKSTENEKTTVEVLKKTLPVTNNLLILGLSKQWKGESGFIFPMHFDYNALEINDMDIGAEV